MFGFKNRTPQARLTRKLERDLSAIAVNELESNQKDQGVWGQALLKANGDNNKAISLYIQLRVDSLKDEIAEHKEHIAREADEHLRNLERMSVVFNC